MSDFRGKRAEIGVYDDAASENIKNELFKPIYIDGRRLWKVFDQAGFFVDREDRDIAQQAIEDMMQNEGIEIENSCYGCVYENADDTTDAIGNCVCCIRINDVAKNDYYRKI